MIALIARAAKALVTAVRNPAVRKAAIEAAKKAGNAMKNIGNKAVQGCKIWQRNRAIRQAYNARRRVLAKEIQQMKRSGSTSREMAEKAHKFRHKERMLAREQMRKNGDADLVKKLEARDLKKYGNKDGPNLADSQARAKDQLQKKLGREPTSKEIDDSITESATKTDWATNLKFLSF